MRWCLRIRDGSPTGAAGCGAHLTADSRGAGAEVNGVQGRICAAPLSARSASLCAALAVVGAVAWPMLQLSSTTGQRQRKEKLDVSLTSPGQRPPQGLGVSVPDFYKGVPAIPRRRQEVCACADRPADALFLFHRARRILFLALPKREWGAHPRGNGPLAGASPPRPAARISPGGH